MSFSELWHNGAKRLLLILIAISFFILLLAAAIFGGIFVLTDRVQAISKKQKEMTDVQSMIASIVNDNTSAIKAHEDAVNEQWLAFQQHSPTFPVPQTEEENGKSDIIIVPPKEKPTPTPRPPKPKVIIRYKSRPTPTPFRFFGNPHRK